MLFRFAQCPHPPARESAPAGVFSPGRFTPLPYECSWEICLCFRRLREPASRCPRRVCQAPFPQPASSCGGPPLIPRGSLVPSCNRRHEVPPSSGLLFPVTYPILPLMFSLPECSFVFFVTQTLFKVPSQFLNYRFTIEILTWKL